MLRVGISHLPQIVFVNSQITCVLLSFDLYVRRTNFSGYSGSLGNAFQAMDLDSDKNFSNRYFPMQHFLHMG